MRIGFLYKFHLKFGECLDQFLGFVFVNIFDSNESKIASSTHSKRLLILTFFVLFCFVLFCFDFVVFCGFFFHCTWILKHTNVYKPKSAQQFWLHIFNEEST